MNPASQAVNPPLFFESWIGMGRTLLIGVLAYAALITLLRLSGKRTLSKMNAFDLVVTVALGSTFATVLVNKNVPLAEGVLAFGLLIGLQFVVTWLSVRSERIEQLVKSEPSLLAYQGEYCRELMKRQRVTTEEVRAAVRMADLEALSDVHAVVLETDGTLSVIPRDAASDGPAHSILPALDGRHATRDSSQHRHST